jgi:hypothetical protein
MWLPTVDFESDPVSVAIGRERHNAPFSEAFPVSGNSITTDDNGRARSNQQSSSKVRPSTAGRKAVSARASRVGANRLAMGSDRPI